MPAIRFSRWDGSPFQPMDLVRIPVVLACMYCVGVAGDYISEGMKESMKSENSAVQSRLRAQARNYASLPSWERQYDFNRNGILDKSELEAMAKAGGISVQELESRRAKYCGKKGE